MTTQQRYAEMTAINEMFYYINNAEMVKADGYMTSGWVPSVIDKCDWPCGHDHAVDSWNSIDDMPIVNKFIVFYGNLDNENRKAMLNWILDNYKSGLIL